MKRLPSLLLFILLSFSYGQATVCDPDIQQMEAFFGDSFISHLDCKHLQNHYAFTFETTAHHNDQSAIELFQSNKQYKRYNHAITLKQLEVLWKDYSAESMLTSTLIIVPIVGYDDFHNMQIYFRFDRQGLPVFTIFGYLYNEETKLYTYFFQNTLILN